MNLSRLSPILKTIPFAESAAIALLTCLLLTSVALVSARERARNDVRAWIEREQEAQSSFLETAPLLLEVGAGMKAKELERRLLARGHRFTRTREGLRIVVIPRGSGRCELSTVDILLEQERITRLTEDGAPIDAILLPGVRFDRNDPDGNEFRLRASIPEPLMKATVAIEDRRFYGHGGVDVRATVRAALANLSAGGAVQGGSTITQQLAKNLFLDRERTLDRKLREVFLAVALEETLTKKQILEAYLNEIHFGRAYGRSLAGAGAAAEAYFGKPVECLDLAESAILAGIIRAPNGLSPLRHPLRAKQRANVVLRAMKREMMISEDELAKIDLDEVSFASHGLTRLAPHFADFARKEVAARGNGASIAISTIDLELQSAAEHAIADGLYELDHKAKAPLEGALVALEAKTGRILAMVGGRDYQQSSFNRAAQARRQIGSLVKPFVALAALRDRFVDTNSVLLDEPISIPTKEGPWTPRNVDYVFRGPVILHRALTNSINIPFVRLSQEIGISHVASLLNQLHLRENPKTYPSLALGAFEATPLQVAAAFAAIANDGTYHEPYAVERIVDPFGVTIWERTPKEEHIASLTAARQVYEMMRSVVSYGTGHRVRALGYRYEVAGKTGTTDDTRDGWFVGMDGELVVVVWVGADDPVPTGLLASDAAVPIWARFMLKVRRDRPPPPRPLPESLRSVFVCNHSGMLATPYCPDVSRVVVRRDTQIPYCETFDHFAGNGCNGDRNDACSFVIDESHGEETRLQRDDH